MSDGASVFFVRSPSDGKFLFSFLDSEEVCPSARGVFSPLSDRSLESPRGVSPSLATSRRGSARQRPFVLSHLLGVVNWAVVGGLLLSAFHHPPSRFHRVVPSCCLSVPRPLPRNAPTRCIRETYLPRSPPRIKVPSFFDSSSSSSGEVKATGFRGSLLMTKG